MSFEIEKKYCVLNYDLVKQLLDSEFGKSKRIVKAGYWWTECADPSTPVTEVVKHKIQEKNIALINGIAEIKIPETDYQYARIRVVNNSSYVLTVKNKSMQNGIEQNVEYEYEIDSTTVNEVINFLSQGFYIFYYNVKDTLLYTSGDLSIELSKFNDLTHAYLEVELTGKNQKELNEKLNDALSSFNHYPIKEELLSYNQLSKNENQISLRNKKLRDYSKEALNSLRNSF